MAAVDPIVLVETIAARLRGKAEELRATDKHLRAEPGSPWRRRGNASMVIAANALAEVAEVVDAVVYDAKQGRL